MEFFIKKLQNSNKARFDNKTLEYITSDRREIKVRNSSIKVQIDKQSFVFVHQSLAKYNQKNVEVRIRQNDFEKDLKHTIKYVIISHIYIKGQICYESL